MNWRLFFLALGALVGVTVAWFFYWGLVALFTIAPIFLGGIH